MPLSLETVLQAPVDASCKGFPYTQSPLPLEALGTQGWNLLQGDLPFPVAVLKDSALRSNSAWMRRFTEAFGVKLAPHGKTTMAPQLFDLQLQDGAWGITVANVHQLRLCAQWGVPRVLIANQVVGPQEREGLWDTLQAFPHLEVVCLVDSVANVEQLAAAAPEPRNGLRLGVLVELGVPGARTGCRTEEEVLALAEHLQNVPALALRGLEAYEAVLRGPNSAVTIPQFMETLNRLAQTCWEQDWFAPGPVILSAGGSDYYDLVAQSLSAPEGATEVVRILRSGCYLTHDSEFYRHLFEQICERSPDLKQWGKGLEPALQVWGVVQSLPEPGLALVTAGKRDLSYDIHLPVPELHFQPGSHTCPQALAPEHYQVTALNDQHAYLKLPPEAGWKVGDLVGMGISHPCTTFDRWRLLHVVDEQWNVVSAVRTFLA